MGIFVGALLWLAGARIGGHEEISNRYWGTTTLLRAAEKTRTPVTTNHNAA